MGDERDRLGFLKELGPALAEAYSTAERTAFDAPRLAYVALRGFAELLLSHPVSPAIEDRAFREGPAAWATSSPGLVV